MKLRKSIAFIIAVIMLAAIAAPVTAVAVKSGDFEYEVVDNCAVITKYTGSQTGHFVIPSTLDGYTVTEIGGDNVFRLQKFTGVTFPSTLRRIGKGAFSNCGELTSIVLPNSVTDIDEFAFSGCKKVSTLILSNNTQSIGYRAFVANHSLKSFIIPKSVQTIKQEAFGYDIDVYGKLIKRTFENLTVYGYKNTAGEQYCKDNSFTFVTLKESNPMKVTAKKTVSAKAKKKTTIKKAVTVKSAKGAVTYKTNNKKVAVKKGTMTVAKGLKKGKTYTVKVSVTAAGNSDYRSLTKTVKIKIKVK